MTKVIFKKFIELFCLYWRWTPSSAMEISKISIPFCCTMARKTISSLPPFTLIMRLQLWSDCKALSCTAILGLLKKLLTLRSFYLSLWLDLTSQKTFRKSSLIFVFLKLCTEKLKVVYFTRPNMLTFKKKTNKISVKVFVKWLHACKAGVFVNFLTTHACPHLYGLSHSCCWWYRHSVKSGINLRSWLYSPMKQCCDRDIREEA